MPSLPPSRNSVCCDCFRNKSVCDNHTDLYNSLNCDVRPCETCKRSLKKDKILACEEFCNLLPISDQESACQKFGKQISVPFSHSSLTKMFLTLSFVVFMILDINIKWASNFEREQILMENMHTIQRICQWCSLQWVM